MVYDQTACLVDYTYFKGMNEIHLFSSGINVRNFLWEIERYQRAVEVGIFTKADPIELLEGRLILRPPSDPVHAATVSTLTEYFFRRYLDVYEIRSENPVALPPNSEPEPDLVLAKLREDQYYNAHPGPEDLLLVIEVADSTLELDRQVKAPIYAAANVAEYWIVNLRHRIIEVYLAPDLTQRLYTSVQHYRPGSKFTSPLLGEVRIDALLLPMK